MRILERPERRIGTGPKRAAFTLVELLTVIAIVAILAAITIPALGGARDSANRAKTKAQFSQWAAAMELFRQEYGYYPDVAVNGRLDTERFVAELTGRTLDGLALGAGYGNRKGLRFYTLAAEELDEEGELLMDAFGNTEIGVRVDTNRDGLINGSDSGSWVTVGGLVSADTFSPAGRSDLVPTSGVRAGVVFYSAGSGKDESDLVLSWQ